MLPTACRTVAQVLAAALALTLAGPQRAHAWTRAQVTHVGAQLDASHAPGARVRLEVGLRVTGGWLSRFELAGLDADLALAADAPIELVSQDGATTFLPEASLSEPGTLVIRFPDRSSAPHRGDYLLRATYDTRALHAHGERRPGPGSSTLRLRWTLPRWDVSLSDVRIVVRAPAGTRATPEADSHTLLDALSVHEQAGGTELVFARTELPRTQSFEVAFDVPAQASATPAPNPARGPAPSSLPLTLGLCLALLALAKRALGRRTAVRERLDVLALVPLPRQGEVVRGALVLAGCVGSGGLAALAPLGSALLGVLGVSLALDQGFVRRPLPRDIQTRAATLEDLEGTHGKRLWQLAGPSAWLDATTPAGLCLLSMLHAPGLWLAADSGALTAWSWSALLATPLFITATRLSRPVTVEHALHHLGTLRSALRDLPVRTELVVHATKDGRCLEARLRLRLARVPPGMGKLELVVTDAMFYGRPRWTLSWLAQCRANSTADMLLARALPDARRETCSRGERVARLSVTLDVTTDAQHLLGWLAEATHAQAA